MSGDQAEASALYTELAKDIEDRIKMFVDFHPDLVGVGMVVEMTLFAPSGEAYTFTTQVGVGRSPARRLAILAGKVQQGTMQIGRLLEQATSVSSEVTETLARLREEADRFVHLIPSAPPLPRVGDKIDPAPDPASAGEPPADGER